MTDMIEYIIIKFNQDCNIVVQDTTDSMPYSVKYSKGEIEHIDILIGQSDTIHVQFDDGSVGWIKNRYIEIIPFVDD